MYSEEFKNKVYKEYTEEGIKLRYLTRKYGFSANSFYGWGARIRKKIKSDIVDITSIIKGRASDRSINAEVIMNYRGVMFQFEVTHLREIIQVLKNV